MRRCAPPGRDTAKITLLPDAATAAQQRPPRKKLSREDREGGEGGEGKTGNDHEKHELHENRSLKPLNLKPLFLKLDHLKLEPFQKLCSRLRGWKSCPTRAFSLTPGFSPVPAEPPSASRFNGFPPRDKPLKRLIADGFAGTGLKPGVNEMSGDFYGNALMTKDTKNAKN